MRLFILLAFVLLFFAEAQAQNRNRFRHIIKANKVTSGYLPLEYRVGGVATPIAMCSPKLEGVISLVNGVPVIDFFTITSPPVTPGAVACIDGTTVLNTAVPATTGQFILNLARPNLGSPTIAVKVPFAGRSFSVSTMPFRYRFKATSAASTISTNLSASLNYGLTWGYSTITHRAINHYSLTIGPFAGVSSAELKKSTVSDPATWTTDRTNAALSYGLSVTIARNNLGLVVSLGYDHALGFERQRWAYQDRPWIGIGINPSLGIF